MEKGFKKRKVSASLLNLKDVLGRDILNVILKKLDRLDWKMVWVAHNPEKAKDLKKSCTLFNECAIKGYLKLLKWLHKNGCSSKNVVDFAAENGHLKIVKWLSKKEFDWSNLTCCYAAYGGHLEVLKWLRNNGCPWDKWMCVYAARGGQLEILKWLRANGCPSPIIFL